MKQFIVLIATIVLGVAIAMIIISPDENSMYSSTARLFESLANTRSYYALDGD